MINSTTANMRVERHNTRTPSLLAAAIAKVAAHPTASDLLHVQEIALVMSLALRFLPTIADETVSIRDAQAARGGSALPWSRPCGTPCESLVQTVDVEPVFSQRTAR